MCRKRNGPNNKYGQYIVKGQQGGGILWRVIWLNTNEQVGLFETKGEAEKECEKWNRLKVKMGKRPV